MVAKTVSSLGCLFSWATSLGIDKCQGVLGFTGFQLSCKFQGVKIPDNQNPLKMCSKKKKRNISDKKLHTQTNNQ